METNQSKTWASRLNYPVMVLSVVTGVLVASLYVYVAQPLYNSTAKVISPVSEIQQTSVTIFDSPESVFTEQVKNETFLAQALENNPGLLTTYVESDYRTTPASYSFPYTIKYTTLGNKSFPLQQYSIEETGPNTFALLCSTYGVERAKNGTYGTKIIDNNLELTITKKGKSPFQQNGIITTPSYKFKIHSGASKATELLAEESKLQVADQNGMIKITVQEDHPEAAASIANAIAQGFLKSKSGISETNSSTEPTIENITAQIAVTESEISKYKRDHQITDINADTETGLSMLNELKLQKTELEVQLASLDNLSTYLRKNREINNSQVEYGLINDPAFSENLSRLNQCYDRKSKGENNPEIESEIANLKTLIAERLLNTRKKTAVQIDKIGEAIHTAQKNISRLPEQASTLVALERKMQLDKKVYDMLIEKKAAAIVNGSISNTNSKLITTATLPTTATWPSLSWMLALGALLGSFAGVTISLLISLFNQNKIRNRSEISEVTRLPFIATIGDPALHVNSPVSVVNNLCTAVLMKPGVQTITVTSSNKHEGKTFVATQLAQALAAIDKKVLLLDMNLGNQAISNTYGVTPHNTLAEVLNGNCDIHDAICLTSFPNLEILSPGIMAAGVNSFLSSGKKEEVLNMLKKHYDFIIIDTCDTGAGVDAVAMMKLSDLNLYVVQAKTTRKTSLVSAERIKSDYNIEDIYLVLNNMAKKQQSNPNSRTRNRTINIQRNTQQKPTFIPQVLKKIALWFY